MLTHKAEHAEINSKTSSITKSAENLSLDMVKDPENGGNGDGGNDKIVKKSPFSKKSSGLIGYVTLVHFEKITWKTKQSYI